MHYTVLYPLTITGIPHMKKCFVSFYFCVWCCTTPNYSWMCIDKYNDFLISTQHFYTIHDYSYVRLLDGIKYKPFFEYINSPFFFEQDQSLCAFPSYLLETTKPNNSNNYTSRDRSCFIAHNMSTCGSDHQLLSWAHMA